MAFLFKRNPKTPVDIVKALCEQLLKLDTATDKRKVQDEIFKHLSQIKMVITGGDEHDPQPDQTASLTQEIYGSDLVYLLISNLSKLEFNMRKDVMVLFTTLLRKDNVSRQPPMVDYLLSKPVLLHLLLVGPETPDTALITGHILRDCVQYEALASVVLNDASLWKYFEYTQGGTFENSTDAFTTLSELLTIHRQLAGQFLDTHTERFIENVNRLISTGNYVTKRQSVKLLGHLMFQKTNCRLMYEYISSADNLKLVMILLSDKSKNLQYETFHIFKVFAANPEKTRPVMDILIKNRDKLILFLQNLDVDRKDDMTFSEEKDYVIGLIQDLPRIIPANSTSSVDLPTH